ncbi:ABC transporter ATP-binding protein [Enterococcus sp. MJM12]|uniref:ABC transporter ATP-binding protein n=1 Tax=Candidatus Enterococcus myersii TaxID=2815322 RepID=A0ABS3H8V2_9ENTE|nr:ABC transporter ATP-binding protein [Enterococcus sp. MJM12]MBO0449887.1 ABC transporter ATP-binding protein [Enterococcus sp. MJM12]
MLEIQQVNKSFGAQTILTDIDLVIKPGEIVSILGRSGSGKTTLLNMILGLEKPNSGRLVYKGQDITNVPMAKRGFNIVFQDYGLFPHLTARENLLYGLKRKPSLSTKEEVAELIQLLDLEKHLDKPISALSGGQKQRVALGRTLVMKPEILLLDEPLSALDGVIKESIKEKIQMIAKTLQLTTIIVTHDPEEALTLSDKVMVLENGRVAKFAAPAEIIAEAGSPFIQDFVVAQLETKYRNIQNIFALFQGTHQVAQL